MMHKICAAGFLFLFVCSDYAMLNLYKESEKGTTIEKMVRNQRLTLYKPILCCFDKDWHEAKRSEAKRLTDEFAAFSNAYDVAGVRFHMPISNSSDLLNNKYVDETTKLMAYIANQPSAWSDPIFDYVFAHNKDAYARFTELPYGKAMLRLADVIEDEKRFPISWLSTDERYAAYDTALCNLYYRIEKERCRDVDHACIKPHSCSSAMILTCAEEAFMQKMPYSVKEKLEYYFLCRPSVKERIYKAMKDGMKSGLAGQFVGFCAVPLILCLIPFS